VNYYERYCGDYARDTAHLTLEQHGAYTAMLDAQYSTERGLPADYDALYRICRAMSKTEQTSVRTIADEFFPLAEDGMRWNKRAAKDIEKAQKRIGAARENGNRGGRPKITQRDTPDEPNENPPGFGPVKKTEPIGHIGESTTRHTPKLQSQETGRRAVNGARPNGHGIRLPQGWQLPEDWLRWTLGVRTDWAEERALRESLVFRDYWHGKAGKDARKADWQATWRNWVRRAT
jgi:uncharacterized protein YdaU (DUF1376 family)